MSLKVRLMRGPGPRLPILLGTLCFQCSCVVPRMSRMSPAPSSQLSVRPVSLWRRRKERRLPRDLRAGWVGGWGWGAAQGPEGRVGGWGV